MEKEIKKEIISRIVSILSTSIFLIVTTWFWFGPRLELTEAKSAMTNQAISNLTFTDLSEGMKLENAYPVPDSIGEKIEPYKFQITNHDSIEVTFDITFVNDLLEVQKDNCKVLGNNYLRYTIKRNDDNYTTPRNLALDGTMYVDTLSPGETATYELKFWIDQNAGNEIMDTHFHAKVSIVQVLEDIIEEQ